MKLRIAVTAAAGLALLFTAGFTASMAFWRKTPPQPAKRVVKLLKVGERTGAGVMTYPGRVQPVRHAELFFRVSGPVIDQNLKFGQTVEAGTVLMRIDPRDYQREVERLTHEIEMQQIQAGLADTEYRRQKKLIEVKAVSQAVYDSAYTRKRAADVQLDILKTSLKIAQDKLDDTVLRAPFHGTVGEISIEQYEIAKANVPVVTLQNLRDLEIKVNFPAGNLPPGSIYDGTDRYKSMKFQVTFPGRGNRVFEAVIREFKPVAASTSETYELILEMKQPPDFAVLPGMTAEVHGLPNSRRAGGNGFTLPFSAVVNRESRAGVWVYDHTTRHVSFREVTTGKPDGNTDITIEKGLKSGEYIVAAGGDWLSDNAEVQVLNPEVFHERN